MAGYIYFLTNRKNSTFYIGVTSKLERRYWEHKNKLLEGFTKRYNLTKLVYFEEFPEIEDAIKREKQLKNWHRNWKLDLIKTLNPEFKDLDSEINSG